MTKLIILAAGEGTRLKEHTVSKPKCMVTLKERTLIEWQLCIAKTSGLDDIIIIGGYKFEQLKFLEKQNVKLAYNPFFSATNMVSTLFCVKEQLKDTVLISYGDIIYSKNILIDVINFKGDIGVVADLRWLSYWEQRSSNPLDDAESFKVNEDGYIIDIGNKENKLDNIEAQYIGLIKLSGKGTIILKKIYDQCLLKGNINGKKIEKAFMTDLIQELIFSGERVSPIFTKDPWIEIDTVEDLNNEITTKRLNDIVSTLQ